MRHGATLRSRGAGRLVYPSPDEKEPPRGGLSALACPEQADVLAVVIPRETPTLGVRMRLVERIVADRRERAVEIPWGQVRVKEKWLDGRKVAVPPEYEDCARIARERGIPLQDVYAAVLQLSGRSLAPFLLRD